MAIGNPVPGTLVENPSAATSLDVPYPAGISAGDLLLMWVVVSVATAPSTPSGWTSIVPGSSGTGSQSPAGRWMRKVATGLESGSQTVSHSNATSHGLMWRASGVDQTTPIDVVGTHIARAIGEATTHPGVTTTMPGCQVWASGFKNSGSLAWDPITSPFTMTEVLDDTSPYPTCQASYRTWTGSGATGEVVFDSANAVRAGYDVFALRPAVDTISGTAAVSAPAATAAAVAELTVTGTAATAARAPEAAAAASLTIAGEGAATAPAATAAGTATLTAPAVGAAVAPASQAAATGVLVLAGAAAIHAPPATAAAAATLTIAGTGAVVAPAATGSGVESTLTGTGALAAPAATTTGTAALTLTGTAAAAAPAATGAGTAGLRITGAGSVTAPPAVAAGTGGTAGAAPTAPLVRHLTLTVPARTATLTTPARTATLTAPARTLTITEGT